MENPPREHEELRTTVRMLEEEITVLRRRLQDAPRRVRVLEERLLESRNKLAQAAGQNQKLSTALEETREQLALLRDDPGSGAVLVGGAAAIATGVGLGVKAASCRVPWE